MTVLLHKYYIKEPDDPWILRSRVTSGVQTEYTPEEIDEYLNPWLELLYTLPGYVSFTEEYFDENTMRYTMTFDVPDDKAIDTYKNFIKVMRNRRNPEIKSWDSFVESKHAALGVPFPKSFYQTEDSTGKTIEYQLVTL